MTWQIGSSALMVALATGFACAADGEVGSTANVYEQPIDDYDRSHWSFQPISRPSLPSVEQASWPQTAVDYFVLRGLERAKLVPAPRAKAAALLRRLKFDLVGLPPTPAEIVQFEAAPTSESYRQLVDRLLGSPAYGERWAQHWLDLARFAETDGFEHDKVRQDAWKYRQWVIEALNADLPYDQFVRLQLTGDLTGREQDVIATMFCLAGPDMPDINEQDLRRHDRMNDITSTVGGALLGLQLHCAQCHDHKYDPISQADFYRLRGVFEAAVPEMKRDQPVVHFSPQSMAIAPWIYFRGEHQARGPELTPRPPRVVSSPESREAFDTRDPRVALADWLFAEDNPLAARVVANRIWQHHFGRSLCENPNDFGLIAGEPSHPELLDWLAAELRESHWSIKHLHRVILLSATYQQAGHACVDSPTISPNSWELAFSEDPQNRLFSRFPRKRLEGEAIRDALIAVSGQLNLACGGPSVMPPLPPELLTTILKGQWQTSENIADHTRRSIYVFARRNLRYPIFDVFDRPDAGASCGRRDRSTTAIQSLQMLNGDLAFRSAQHLRDRLLDKRPAPIGDVSLSEQHDHEFLVEQLFLTALSRHPIPAEVQRFVALLKSPKTNLQDSLLVACVAILNASEFVYVE